MNVHELELACVPYTLACVRNGLRVDVNYLNQLTKEFAQEQQRINDEIDAEYGVHVNPKSPKQVSEMLHAMHVYPRRGMSTDADTMAKYAQHSIIQKIIAYRHYKDLQDKYTKVLVKKVDSNNRVHPDIKTTWVVTGRWSTSDPNVLAIPVRSSAGKKIRRAFIADDDYCILSCDFSQLEMRTTAHVSEDEAMIDTFKRGADIHSETCQRMFGEVTKEKRYAAKRTGFGVLYGISPKGLFDLFVGEGITTFTEGDCANFIRFWFKAYPQVAAAIDDITAFIRRNGWCADIFGRRRLVPEANSVHERIRAVGIRAGVNHVIGQSPASGVIKHAMASLIPDISDAAKPLLQVHDELLWEVRLDCLLEVAEVIKAKMESAVELSIPLKVDIEVGESWGEQTEITL